MFATKIQLVYSKYNFVLKNYMELREILKFMQIECQEKRKG